MYVYVAVVVVAMVGLWWCLIVLVLVQENVSYQQRNPDH